MKSIHVILFLLISTTFTITACRKTVIQDEKTNTETVSSIENKFFSMHKSEDLEGIAIVEFIKRKNSSIHFVEATANQIGFPRWDKIVKTKTANVATVNSFGTSKPNDVNTTSKFNTYYIPFVRDSQNYVNASMVIRTSPSDTLVSYLCDWQYARIQNDNNKPDDKAEHFALLFMSLDNKVFGSKKFTITDKNIFNNGRLSPREVELKTTNINSGVRSNLLVEYCQDFIVSYTNCPYIANPVYGGKCPGTESGVCDNCYLCTEVVTLTFCWEEWSNGGGGGGTGGGTGGDGGWSGGGGFVPPTPCETGQSIKSYPKTSSGITSYFAMPCDGNPGWTPGGYADLPSPDEQTYSDDLGRMITFGEINDAFENNPGMIDAIEQGLDFSEHGYPLLPGTTAIEVYLEYNALKSMHPSWNKVQLMSVAYWNVVKGEIHFVLDIAGMVPVVGEAADIANGVIYFLEGDKINAVISAASAVPIYGWVSTAGKWVRTAVEIKPLSSAVGKIAFRAIKTSKGAVRMVKVAIGALDQAVVKALKAVKPADQTLTNLSREIVDQQSHRIAPLAGTVKSKVDDIVLNGDLLGTKTEDLCDEIFQTKGFVKQPSKFGSNNGFDGVFIKYDANNNVQEIIINESKQVASAGNIKLNGRTPNKGPQMSEEWIGQTIDEMKGNPNLSILGNLLDVNRSKITKTVTAVDKSAREIVVLKLSNY